MRCPPIRLGNLLREPSLSKLLKRTPIVLVVTLALCLLPFLVHALVKTRTPKTGTTHNKPARLARLSEAVIVHAAGRGNPTINLSDGHDVLTSYVGPQELQVALEQNLAAPLSLASADFDEDGMPDLVSGYSYNGQGIVTLLRGNVDSIYPNAPEAKQRKADGSFTPAPFLSPALAVEAGVPADFLGAGDFDADGHWDIVLAARGGTSLYFLPGNGKGEFGAEKEISLNGGVTAFTTGEINRRDGLTDIVVGIDGPDGPKACVFEGPLGAMRGSPEILTLPAPAVSFALGEIDGDYPMDLVIAAGNHLIIAHGRDRKLSLSEANQATVSSPQFTARIFDFDLRSVAIGDFSGDGFKDLALLSTDGAVHILTQPAVTAKEWAVIKGEVENYTAGRTSRFGSAREGGTAPLRILPPFQFDSWQIQTTGEQLWPGARSITTTRVSSVPADTLVLLDPSGRQMRVVSKAQAAKVGTESPERATSARTAPSIVSWQTLALDVSANPTAVLPMRLDTDALSDLVVLREGATQPTIVPTEAGKDSTQPPSDSPQYATFTNPGFFFMSAFFATPGKSDPYPSTIDVSGVTDPNSKIRMKLNRFGSGKPSVVDLILVSPAGQKVMLMSDVGGTQLTSGLNITFDDSAPSSIGSLLATGSFKPTNFDDGNTDVFPSPAPSSPYASTLAAFNGNNLNGTWKLYGMDDGGGGTSIQSSLQDGWTLIFGDDPPPQNFVVNSAADTDDGACDAANCTLREAIKAANAKPGADRISFSIGSGPQTITPAPFLPDLTEAVTIDATTQPGFAGVPIIEINGMNVGSFTDGLVFRGGNSVIRGLVVNRFTDEGIVLLQGGSNIVEGNYIGTDIAGNLDRGNTNDGLDIDTANNVVGGTTAAARNLISGNNYNGIIFGTFYSDPAENNVVQGNYIGTNAAGTGLIGNTFNGISTNSAPGSPNNLIGGTTAGARNIIAGGGSRILISYVGSSGTLVQGNFLGTDVTGTVDIDGVAGSGGDGVDLEAGVGSCLVGGTTPAARNIISGNWYGVEINTNNVGSPPPALNLVQGNFIGTNVNGNASVKNLFSGVFLLFGATQNTIGGSVAEARNIISGNQKSGIEIGSINFAATFTNVIQKNYIGTDLTGNNPLGNGTNVDPSGGIIIPANADGDRIEANRIAYNFGSGIRITNVTGNNQPGIRILIVDNEIFANTGLGIDLGGIGVTANDPQDTDSGPNLLQNFPALISVTGAASGDGAKPRRDNPDVTVTVNGTLNSAPNTTFTVNWYFSADAQCVTNQETTRPLVFGKVPNVITNSSGDAQFNFPLDLPVGINNGIVNCTATDPQNNTSEFSSCLVVNSTPPKTVQFSSASYSVSETGPRIDVTVTRSGDTSAAASVNFVTNDNAGLTNCNVFNGIASPRCDYTNTGGTLQWAAGDASSKSFSVAIVDDAYAEGNETFTVSLNSPSGVTLGTQSTATVTITENDATNGTNPIDSTGFFVRQQYIDFLGREPDPPGLAGWSSTINNCSGDTTQCDRIHVSQLFFQSAEFQERGYFVYRFYPAAFGRKPDYSEFVADLASVSGFLDANQLEAAKVAFINAFMARTAFANTYNPLNNTQYVDALLGTAGVTLSIRQTMINGLNGATMTRAQVLRQIVESSEVSTKYNHQAYAVMEYFGYLRRQPDGFYLQWIADLDLNNNPRGMVTGFVTSAEYRLRFGP